MKHRFFRLSVFLFVVLISNGIFGQNEWIRYEVDEDFTFSVDVPGNMEASSKSIKTVLGELNTLTYAYQGTAEDPNYLYLINFVQYPEGTFPVDSIDLIQEYLDNSVITSAEKVNGEVVYSSDLDREQGKLFRVKYNDGGAVIKGKSIIREDVFISLQVFTVQSKSLNDEMDFFLDSFKLDL